MRIQAYHSSSSHNPFQIVLFSFLTATEPSSGHRNVLKTKYTVSPGKSWAQLIVCNTNMALKGLVLIGLYLLKGYLFYCPWLWWDITEKPGWGLVFEVEYYPRKKIHEIRVVFHPGFSGPCTCVPDVHCGHRLGVQKTCKIGKKGRVFVMLTNFGKVMTMMTDKLRRRSEKKKKKKKRHATTRILGSISIPGFHGPTCLGCVLKLPFPAPFTRKIPILKYKCPPPPRWKSTLFKFWTKIEPYYESSFTPYNKFFI